MALWGAILSAGGAALVLLEVLARRRSVSNVLDGGGPDTDYEAELRKAKRRELASGAGPLLVLVGAVLTVAAL